jgi:hypothetical protein
MLLNLDKYHMNKNSYEAIIRRMDGRNLARARTVNKQTREFINSQANLVQRIKNFERDVLPVVRAYKKARQDFIRMSNAKMIHPNNVNRFIQVAGTYQHLNTELKRLLQKKY